MNIRLSVVVPAYNEEDRLVKTLRETISYLNDRDYRSEVIVVSDGSTDGTGDVVRRIDPGVQATVRLLAYFPNRGKGYAVRYGMIRALGDIVMFMDADYSVEMKEVEKGLALLETGADIAIASRAVAGATVTQHQNTARELSAKLYTFIQNRHLGIRFKDTQCGFKLFKRAAALDLFARQRLHSVIFDPEILWLGTIRGYRIAEFPVAWHHMENSRIQYDSFRKSLFVFQELFRIKKLHQTEE